jgi:hypothetical protein
MTAEFRNVTSCARSGARRAPQEGRTLGAWLDCS